MLYPVCDVPYRQHQAPTILAAMTGRTYAESKTAVKLHLSLKIKSISPSNFMTVLERCGFHVVRQYAEFDEQIWLAVDSVSQVMPEVPLVLERTAERSLSAEQAQKMQEGRGSRKASYAMLAAALRPEGFRILNGKSLFGTVLFGTKQIVAPRPTTPASFVINVYLFFLVRHWDLHTSQRRQAAWEDTISFLDQNDVRFPAMLRYKQFDDHSVS